MRYEYNANLEFPERVSLVSKEIKEVYPEIPDDIVEKAAAISLPINDKVTNDDKFDRLYRILYILNENNNEMSHVFNDLYAIYEDGLTNQSYIKLMGGLVDYYNGMRESFPELVEYR